MGDQRQKALDMAIAEIEGFAERMIFREFYPRGLTALDDFNEVTLGTRPTMSHATARQEVANLLNSINLGSLLQPAAAQTPGEATPESDRGNLVGLLERRGGARSTIHLVHRLDLGTSGLIMFAKTETALRVLSERFRTHELIRQYLAVVAGPFPPKVELIEQPIAGKTAVTRVEVLERFSLRATLIRCTLETGRTHQIRIHCKVLGHPVLGDRQHGKSISIDPPRMALHAARLALPHPISGAPLDFESPWPEDLAPWLAGLSGPGSRSGA